MDWELVGGDPVPVDLEQVLAAARTWSELGLEIGDWLHVTRSTVNATDTVWRGAAATAFEGAGLRIVDSVQDWPHRLAEAADALRRFAAEAGDLQADARSRMARLPDGATDPWLASSARVLLDADPDYQQQLHLVRAQIEGIRGDYAHLTRRTAAAIRAALSGRTAMCDPSSFDLPDAAQLQLLDQIGPAERSHDYRAVNGLLGQLSVAERITLFHDLGPDDARVLAVDDPQGMGNTDGVPLAARAAANAVRIAADLARARQAGDQTIIDRLTMLQASGGQVVLYDPGQDHYGVMFGDAATASHLAVCVRGVGSDHDLPGWITDSQRLYGQAGPGTAVILWKGYHDPDITEATHLTSAEDGAPALASFAIGLNVRADQTLTVVAHSYGTVVTGLALSQAGLKPTNVVALGSPGMTVDNISGLHLKPGQFYAEKAPNDFVTNNTDGYGADPALPGFGGTRLTTNAAGHPGVSGHSDYFKQNTQSLAGISDVIMDRVRPDDVQTPTLGDMAGDQVARNLPSLPDIPGLSPDDNKHLNAVLDNNAGTGIRDGLDAIGDGLDTVGEAVTDKINDFAHDITHPW